MDRCGWRQEESEGRTRTDGRQWKGERAGHVDDWMEKKRTFRRLGQNRQVGIRCHT
jgi:hypothetical protein